MENTAKKMVETKLGLKVQEVHAIDHWQDADLDPICFHVVAEGRLFWVNAESGEIHEED